MSSKPLDGDSTRPEDDWPVPDEKPEIDERNAMRGVPPEPEPITEEVVVSGHIRIPRGSGRGFKAGNSG